MDPLAILEVVTKGLSIVEAVWDNRELALSAFNSVKHIVEGHKTMTPAGTRGGGSEPRRDAG
jgi:hypothetical protein